MPKKKATTKKKGSKKKPEPQAIQLPKISPETWGLLLLGFSLILSLSLWSFVDGNADANLLGLLGHALAFGSHYLFGVGSYALLPATVWLGYQLAAAQPREGWWRKGFLFTSSLCSFCVIANVVAENFPEWVADCCGRAVYSELVSIDEGGWEQVIRYYLGGVPLYDLYIQPGPLCLRQAVNDVGVLLIAGLGLGISLTRLFQIPIQPLLQKLATWWSRARQRPVVESSEDGTQYVKLRKAADTEDQPLQKKGVDEELLPIRPETELTDRPSLSRKGRDTEFLAPEEPEPIPEVLKKEAPAPKKKRDKREQALHEQALINGDFTEYELPGAVQLTKAKKVDQSALKKDLRRQAEVLQETLHSFGIEAKVGRINCGPTITLFEVHPAIGVKVQKIRALEHDIALNMEAKSIRIIAPIPGKAAVGIEVPNPYPQEVGFRELMNSYKGGEQKLELPLLLGKTVNGDNVITDLSKMPHLIIAGATGSGKSVCINTIVMSLLMNRRPDEVKLLMVDPKKVELSSYSKLPHMLAPVITEPPGACSALNWLVKEMERRYELLKQVGVRNIRSFNNRQRDLEKEESLKIEVPEKLPYIVGIIDELADLMMVASNDIETPIARIAQMARAVGIHMILATQRPSREVITGIIKANFPTRISFKVASRVNSQIILDETGAEMLLGNGDMLFLPPGSHNLIRAQGAFIRDEDITAVVESICKQSPPNYVISSFDDMASEMGGVDDEKNDAPVDALYRKAVDVVTEAGSASTTFLQRKLKVGYARAASIMDQLEDRGVIGPAEGAKPRKVLVGAADGYAEAEDTEL